VRGCDVPYQPNPGRVPPACVIRDEDGNAVSFRNVHVRLFGGFDSRAAGHAPWPAAGGRPPTVWAISKPEPHPFEIEFWDLA
jgi:hypothetical protein